MIESGVPVQLNHWVALRLRTVSGSERIIDSMKILVSLLLLLFLVPAAYGQSRQTMLIKLYFPNTKLNSGDCGVKVFPVTRRIPKTAAVARAVLEQLFAGPTSQEKAKGFYSDF